MMAEVEELVGGIRDEGLRRAVWRLLSEPVINVEAERLGLEEAPAGAYVHHPFKGGLIQHTVATARLALVLCDLVEGVYGGEVDRDVVLAGALLHDVMKRYAYAPDGKGGFASSALGERIDHLSLLVAEMYRLGFPLDVVHAAAAHHGEEGPIKPRTVEALIVSIADLADSELSRRVLRAAEYLLKAAGAEARLSSSREAFQVVRAKALEGLEGVRRLRRGES